MPTPEILYYEVSPRVVRAGRETRVTIQPLFEHARFDSSAHYRIRLVAMEGQAGWTQWPEDREWIVTPADGALCLPLSFGAEQEYVLEVEAERGERPLRLAFHLYAVEEDLFARRPYKGDMHMHSTRSDGRETPAYVPAACRRIGLDFMALTDHGRYAPSLEAIQAYAGVNTDLCIYPGEEVHAPGNPVHIINFGGSFSVNELFKTEVYQQEVQALADSLNELAVTDRLPYAASAWSFEKIRQGQGLGIFCHPYWVNRNRLDVPAALSDLIFERQPYDAYELIGGYFRFEIESNNLQVARYHEEWGRGKRIPIVGVSDAHGCERGELFGWYYTVVFSPSPGLADLIGSIKDLYSTAVEALPGETARAHGPFRLVRFTLFLLREVFPAHDRLCEEEGNWMLAHVAGDPQAAEMLRRLKGRTARFLERCWGDRADPGI